MPALRLLHLSGFQAGRADADSLMRSLHNGAHGAQVHVPAALCHIMRVADIVSELRPFAAHFTYSCHLPLQM